MKGPNNRCPRVAQVRPEAEFWVWRVLGPDPELRACEAPHLSVGVLASLAETTEARVVSSTRGAGVGWCQLSGPALQLPTLDTADEGSETG